MLLNDWGLHHLHLSARYRPDGFAERSKLVLVVAFRPGRVYLVDIIDHGEWADDRLIRIILEEWPDGDLVYKMKGALASGTPLTPSQRKRLRDVGMSTMVEIDRSIYMPSTGYSSSGVATLAVTQADRLYSQLHEFCNRLNSEPGFAVRAMARSGVIVLRPPDFHFDALITGEYAIVDRVTGYAFHLS